MSAIERIEILPEGTAALYGSDAIGGVVNIILRRNFEGIEARVRGSTTDSDATERSAALLAGSRGIAWQRTRGLPVQRQRCPAVQCTRVCAANADFRRFGGTDLRGFASNPGTILDPTTLAPIAAIPHGQDGTQLTAAQLIPGTANYTDNVTDNDILPKQTMRSAFVSASYKMTEKWELAADGRYSTRDFRFTYPVPPDDFLVPATNAFNHLGGPVLVAYDFSRDFGPVVDRGPTDDLLRLRGRQRRAAERVANQPRRVPMRRRLRSLSSPTSPSTTRPSMQRWRAPTRRPRSISSGMARIPTRQPWLRCAHRISPPMT